MMHRAYLLWIIFLLEVGLVAGVQVKTVDFLAPLQVTLNGAGPLLVKADPERNRIILVNTYTSSVTLISGQDHRVANVAIGSRIPQYLKSESLAIDSHTGNVYVIGIHALHVVFPKEQTSLTVATTKQFEMVAVDETTGNAFLVGRESKDLAFFDLKEKAMKYIPWAEKEESLGNLNATPPPPIRKVVVDNALRQVIAMDGYAPALAVFSAADGALITRRALPLVAGARWHFAGYNGETHHLYVVVETAERKVVQAARLDARGRDDLVIPLPELTEAVGVTYNPQREEIYIAYDNHPTVHVVDFKAGGAITEIKVPAFGNDGVALDARYDTLYVSSWMWSEIDRIDLKSRRLVKRYLNIGVLPHMFSLAFNPFDGLLYIPLGADAVNGSFGAAVTTLDPATDRRRKIYSGWAPVDLIQRPGYDSFLVFNSEDEFAEIHPDGRITTHKLPFSYPHQAIPSPEGNIYLSYGPHQSYWPTIYIWGAKNGILGINARTLEFYDRRIPELTQGMVIDKDGVLYALQNNWGSQKQYLITLPDEVRSPNLGDMRLELDDTVLRETTQRLLAYDRGKHLLYIGRIGERDEDRGVVQVFDVASRKVTKRLEVGLDPADLAFDDQYLYVTNFSSGTLTRIDKGGWSQAEMTVGRGPLKVALLGGKVYVINHLDSTLQQIGGDGGVYKIPFNGLPDNLAAWRGRLVLTAHSPTELQIISFDPVTGKFELLHRLAYPFGETRFDSANTAFFQRGQFGDVLFDITKIKADNAGRLWVIDFLSGKLFIIN